MRLAALAAALPLVLTATASASAQVASAANATSFVFAGYQVNGPATSVSAGFTVPSLACPAGSTLGVYPGVQLASPAGILTRAGVQVLCQNGAPVLIADVTFNNTVDPVPVTVKAGDKVAVRVTQTATSDRASVADLTQRSSVTVQTNIGATNLVAQVGVGAVDTAGTLLRVPPFGTITFSAPMVDGSAIGASHPTAINRTRLSTLQILTGPLDSTGTSFTTTFKHA